MLLCGITAFTEVTDLYFATTDLRRSNVGDFVIVKLSGDRQEKSPLKVLRPVGLMRGFVVSIGHFSFIFVSH